MSKCHEPKGKVKEEMGFSGGRESRGHLGKDVPMRGPQVGCPWGRSYWECLKVSQETARQELVEGGRGRR